MPLISRLKRAFRRAVGNKPLLAGQLAMIFTAAVVVPQALAAIPVIGLAFMGVAAITATVLPLVAPVAVIGLAGMSYAYYTR